jgi:prepilin-type N-terminal cleavage/methylation domain-containing protein
VGYCRIQVGYAQLEGPIMAICWERIESGARPAKPRLTGFSIIELLVVVAILAVLAAISVPLLMNSIHAIRLRNAGSDFSGILQQARMRAVQDDRFYSVYPISNNGVQQEFVDIYPQQVNGASGSNGGTLDPKDPVVSIANEIVQQPASAAPNRHLLRQQIFGGSSSPPPVLDGSDPISPITFGPQGLPCVPTQFSGGGSACNANGQGNPTAYWVFFQNSVTQDWEAITVTPAGRIQKWTHVNNNWGKM